MKYNFPKNNTVYVFITEIIWRNNWQSIIDGLEGLAQCHTIIIVIWFSRKVKNNICFVYKSFFNFIFLHFYANPRWLKNGPTVIRSLHSDWEMRNDCGNNQLILEIRDVEMSKILVGTSGGFVSFFVSSALDCSLKLH